MTTENTVQIGSFVSFSAPNAYSLLKPMLKDAIGYSGLTGRTVMLLREMLHGKRRAVVTQHFAGFVVIQFLAARRSCTLLPETLTFSVDQLETARAVFAIDGLYYVVAEGAGGLRDVCVYDGVGDDGRTYHRLAFSTPRLDSAGYVVGIASVETMTHGIEGYAVFSQPYLARQERFARHAGRDYPTAKSNKDVLTLNERATSILRRKKGL